MRASGLVTPSSAGDDGVAEGGGEEGKARQGLGPLLGRVVGDRVEGHAGGGELVEDRDAAVDGAGERLVPARVEGADRRGVAGMARGERGDALVPGQAGVEREVPVVEAHVVEEGVDRRVVGEKLAEEQPRVPADEDVADVEDHGDGSGRARGHSVPPGLGAAGVDRRLAVDKAGEVSDERQNRSLTGVCMDRLKGKLCLATAAGQGIGRASVLAMAREGARVIATDLDAGQARRPRGRGHRDRALDVLDPDAIAALADAVGPIDVLFNCAGFVEHGTILDTDDDRAWPSRSTSTSRAMYRMIRAFLPGDDRAGRRLDRQHRLGRLVDRRACRTASPTAPPRRR